MSKINFKNKKITAIIMIFLVVGILIFFIGMKYGQAGNNKLGKNFSQLGDRNMGTQKGMLEDGGMDRNGGATTGEILSKDDKSITVKLRDGGSKIILYSTTTEISKFTAGAIEDLIVGSNIIVNGKTNNDGSIIAQTIQLRPAIQGAQGIKN
jgi:hypothetical protein